MKNWLKENPGGSKANFENYFKAMPPGQKKVLSPEYTWALPLTMTSVYV
jgi:hypothetical protein